MTKVIDFELYFLLSPFLCKKNLLLQLKHIMFVYHLPFQILAWLENFIV
ncbi:hypothetical protein SAMN02927921_00761 [Sinomicrobium oceani]|uniref:Uncharacterized protein n=1 Tax=Sinomicrobium oceani TaxID=1150368 RepID=A0A1K1MR83_9FLAO|nr:hypothetical protein SAMN02927921_00761 [Sinomicrobium oceani]